MHPPRFRAHALQRGAHRPRVCAALHRQGVRGGNRDHARQHGPRDRRRKEGRMRHRGRRWRHRTPRGPRHRRALGHRHDRVGHGRNHLPLGGARHGMPRAHAFRDQDPRQPPGGRVHRGPRPAIHQHREPAPGAPRGHLGLRRHRSHHGTPLRARGTRSRGRLRVHALRERTAPQRQELPRGLRHPTASIHHRDARHGTRPRGGGRGLESRRGPLPDPGYRADRPLRRPAALRGPHPRERDRASRGRRARPPARAVPASIRTCRPASPASSPAGTSFTCTTSPTTSRRRRSGRAKRRPDVRWRVGARRGPQQKTLRRDGSTSPCAPLDWRDTSCHLALPAWARPSCSSVSNAPSNRRGW